MIADQSEMGLRLGGRQHVIDDGMNHRQQAISQTGLVILRMQKIGDRLWIFKIGVTGDHAVHHQITPEIGQHFRGFALETVFECAPIHPFKGARKGHQRLIVQGHGPGTA